MGCPEKQKKETKKRRKKKLVWETHIPWAREKKDKHPGDKCLLGLGVHGGVMPPLVVVPSCIVVPSLVVIPSVSLCNLLLPLSSLSPPSCHCLRSLPPTL
jgi:hypothetical protein